MSFFLRVRSRKQYGQAEISRAVRTALEHLESRTLLTTTLPGGSPLIEGTNGDDVITIVARDSSYNPSSPGVPNPLVDGVQDFTVTVNGGPEQLFTNTPNVFIDGHDGGDKIVVQEPAPDNAVWNVQVYVASGTPSAGDPGDTIELDTPGQDNVTYSPSAPLSAIPSVSGVTFSTPPGGAAQFNDATMTSTITAATFLVPTVYQSSPGGAEQFVYQGGNGNDTLTYNSPSGNASAITYTPGATEDSGDITGKVNGGGSLVPLSFQGIGSTGGIHFTNANGRLDTLIVNGTSAGETFKVSGAGGGTVQEQLNGPANTLTTLPLTTTSISTLQLIGSGGADAFNLTGTMPYTGVTVDADAIVNLSGASGAVTVSLGENSANPAVNPNTLITGYGGQITLIGVDTANLDANNNDFTVTPTTQSDNIVVTPTGATAATFYDDVPSGNNLVPNTVFNVSNVSGDLKVFNDPGGNADVVTIRGTAARDLFEINQASGVAQVLANNVTPLLPVQLGISAEILNVQGLGGENTFQVIPGAGIAGQAQDNLLINIDGGSTGASNALIVGSNFGSTVNPLAANQFAVIERSATADSGFVRVFASAVANPDFNYTNIQTVSPIVTGTNLLVLGPDTYESDNTQSTAAFLGSGATLQIQYASILSNSEHPGLPADQDFYQVVAQSTGTLDFQVAFKDFSTALLPGGGQLNLQVLDAAGDVVGSTSGNFGALGATANARVRIPAVAGQSYFLRVFGATSSVINGYNATIVDTPAPTPTLVALASNAKTTFTQTPTIYVHLDDGALLNDLPGNQTPGSALGVGPLVIPFNTDTTIATSTPGYRIALYDDGSGTPVTGADHTLDPTDPTFIGFAEPVAGVPHEYALTVGSQGPDSLEFGVHNIVARAQFIDPANPTASGFGAFSDAGKITVVNDTITNVTAKAISGKEGRLFSGTVATFTDANLSAPASNFTATIDWGDGQTAAGTIVSDGNGKFHVTSSHAYAEESSAGYTMSVKVTEIGGTSATGTALAKIADSPLDQGAGITTLKAKKNVTASNLTLGTFRDQDSLNTHPGDYVGTIDWGDGSAKSSASFVFTGSTFNVGSFWKAQGTHKYTKTGSFTIKITIKDNSQTVTITSKIKVS